MTRKDDIALLFQANYRSMYRLACCMLHDSEEARDVVSDIFSRLLEGRFVLPAEKREQFLHVCVRNRCLDSIDHLSVKQRMMRHIAIAQVAEARDSGDDERRLEAIRRYVAQELTATERQVFDLRFHRGMKYREMAELLGISEVAVYKNLSRVLAKLKEHIR